MTALENVSYNITDLTGNNLSLSDLGLRGYNIPANKMCAQITVKWHESMVQPETIYLFICLHFFAMLCHEWGHILALKYYHKQENVLAKFGLVGNKPKIWTGAEWQYSALTPKEKVIVYMSGIFAGLIPIFIGILINPFLMINLAFYAWGCYTDVKLIRLNIYGEEKVKAQNDKCKEWIMGFFKKNGKSLPRNSKKQ